ncbi:replication initiation protein [Metarhizobium album]|uniref:Replication initiation protein n=2 Tax=Metarhizobium album TaxID=2182425 RepID=A0A2U2DQW7_9HYPH|nr:plasmid replication protein RepC [Rhizobium album]PWE55697.1 replication initiation protein [Rhizobium album]
MERLATTPFGGARMRADIFSLQAAIARRQQVLKKGEGNDETGSADKWQLLRALTEARDAYGLSDRTLCVLEALTSFHGERVLDGRNPIIVFPSNTELSLRARGMSPATLRRHLALLVEAGLIMRRDSANGKRFCRRDDNGAVESAFGFDLAPLALLAGEIHAHAEIARARAKAVQALRMEITLHLRDIAKTIQAAHMEQRSGPWTDFAEQLAALSGRISRAADMDGLHLRRDALLLLRNSVEKTYLESLSEQEMSANESDFERHIQDSNIEYKSESIAPEKSTAKIVPDQRHALSETKEMQLSLKQFLQACPDLSAYNRDTIRSWNDVAHTADFVRGMLGISPEAWGKARRAMGELGAAVTVAAILQRGTDIRSPGGYLRNLTGKAETGRFSVYPMIRALCSDRQRGNILQ